MEPQAEGRHTFSNALEWILHRPVAVILIIAAVTLLFAALIPKLSFSTSVYDLIIEDLPETARYGEFKQLFGSEEIIRIVVAAENIFDTTTFTKIGRLADEAAKFEGVRRVISLTGIKRDVDLSGKWKPEEFADVLTPVTLFQRNLFSQDHRRTVITLVLKNDIDPSVVIRQTENLIENTPAGISLYQIGMPLVSKALADLTEKDFFRLPPITFLLIALVLFLIFRRMRYLCLPLGCVLIALVWTFGLMSLTGVPMSILTMIVPVFLMAVGTAYCLHIVSEYMTCAQDAGTSKAAVRATFANISFPMVLAVFTTVIGLLSLLINRITMIQEFAIFACFGMLSLLVVVLTFLPAVLSLLPLEEKPERGSRPLHRYVDAFLAQIAHLDIHGQKWTLPILAVVAIFCVVGIFRIPVESNPVGYFKADAPVSRHFHDIYKDLSGSFPLNLVISASEEDYFEDPAHIAEIERIQTFLETLPGVDKAVSFAEYMKLVNYASNQFNPEFYALPQEGFEVRMLMNSYRIMLGKDMLDRFMSPDFSKANILMLTHISSSRTFLDVEDRIQRYLDDFFAKDVTWDVTGFGIVISASNHLLTTGQVKSLSITMVLIFGIMFLLFLSIKVGLVAIVPNMFPIVINFGIMGWLGVELSMGTALIAGIAIGLAVDDTIHYMARYNREFKIDLDDKRALRDTLRHVGRPIVFTTLTISIGFSILVFSSFKPTSIFGIMMVITMFAALVGDLILLPSLMLHVELVTLWDLVRLKLGKEPRYGIPLFKGLSKTQVHYIIMAGSLRKMEEGEVLFRKGEPSDSMFAIISGNLDVFEHSSGGGELNPADLKRINSLKVGEIVGEMGLLRSAPRSATVVATESGELLKINWKMIQRLQWLYPPTANRFFFNLMGILCDRLQHASTCLFEDSRVDDLTGLCNRRAFLETLENEAYRAGRYDFPLSLCLVKIDYDKPKAFAEFDAGDQLIRSAGMVLAAASRKSDIVFRLDTHTFALLRPHIFESDARVECDRVLTQIAALPTEGTLRHRSYLGVAGLDGDGSGPDDSLLDRASADLQAHQPSVAPEKCGQSPSPSPGGEGLQNPAFES